MLHLYPSIMNEETLKIPRHIGYIIDGNRRWAKTHGLPTYEGHLAGYNTLKDILRATVEQGVEFVSIYGFSTENWKRSEGETDKLMKLAIRLFKTDIGELVDENIRLRVLGTEKGLSKKVIEAAHSAEEKTAHCTRASVVICFNYGGHEEILDAAKALIAKAVDTEAVTEEMFANHLYGPDIPPVDIIVRTSGEQRISGFMLWRAAYAELLFLDKLWPDMGDGDVMEIINEYIKRNRRFGS